MFIIYGLLILVVLGIAIAVVMARWTGPGHQEQAERRADDGSGSGRT